MKEDDEEFVDAREYQDTQDSSAPSSAPASQSLLPPPTEPPATTISPPFIQSPALQGPPSLPTAPSTNSLIDAQPQQRSSPLSEPPATLGDAPVIAPDEFFDPNDPNFLIKDLDHGVSYTLLDYQHHIPATFDPVELRVQWHQDTDGRKDGATWQDTVHKERERESGRAEKAAKEVREAAAREEKEQERYEKEQAKAGAAAPARKASPDVARRLPGCLPKIKASVDSWLGQVRASLCGAWAGVRSLGEVHSHHKSERTFANLMLVQQLLPQAHSPVWVAKFSPDGQFLATGGHDGVLRIWRVRQPRAAPADAVTATTTAPTSTATTATTTIVAPAGPSEAHQQAGAAPQTAPTPASSVSSSVAISPGCPTPSDCSPTRTLVLHSPDFCLRLV
ncbi:hypothetical protein PAPYR_6748 [Paratrimastix pyriformis]|uniref:Uncharacterized protein n=1 Tax=Paratrimastix pyriformis TaxID=342808 RepID=A0ABQ8UHP9_9EUKA|nr:hypothetical protein PAPYR_6748 [Paratrimastix pyriformis]